MHHVNIRKNPHFAPYVSIGQPSPLIPTSISEPQGPRSSEAIAGERDAAVSERDALAALRAEMVLDGSAEDVAEADRRVALVALRIEQFDVQHPIALAREADERSEHEAEQKRRKALHRQAMKASAEVAKLADEYTEAARQLASLLAKIREREDLIAEANAMLPEGAEPVPPGEPENGKPGVPSYPHNRLSRRVWLPALGRDVKPIWGEQMPIGRMTYD